MQDILKSNKINNTFNYFKDLLNFYQKLHNISELNIIEFQGKDYLFFTVDKYILQNENNIQYFKEIYLYVDKNLKQITFNSVAKNLKTIGNKLFFIKDLKYLKEKDLNWGIFYFDLEYPFEPILLINDKDIKEYFDKEELNEFNINLIDYRFINNKIFLILRKSLIKSNFKFQDNNLNQVRVIEDIFYRYDPSFYLDSYDILFIKDFNDNKIFKKEFNCIINSFEVIYNESNQTEDILFIANLNYNKLPIDIFNELYFYDYNQDKLNKIETFDGFKLDLRKYDNNKNRFSFIGYEIKDKDNFQKFKQSVNDSYTFLEFFKENTNKLITQEIFEQKYYSIYLIDLDFKDSCYKLKKIEKLVNDDILIGNHLLRDIPILGFKNYKWISKNAIAFTQTKNANVFINLIDVNNKSIVSFGNYFKGDILDYCVKENKIYLVGINLFNKDKSINYLPEIFEIDLTLKNVNKLTNFNEELSREIERMGVSSIKVLEYEKDGADAWAIYKDDLIKGDIFYIHGGPHAAYGNTIMLEFIILANNGYRVFFSNPKGSVSYTLDFANCIIGKWMNEDLNHIKNIIDSIKLKFNIKDLVVAGGSYGGYMSAALISKFNIFKGAVCERGVYNLLSFISTTDFPLFWLPYFKKNNIFELLDISPIKYYENIDTNVLIIHSEGDFRCPISQAEELYTLLKINNKNNKIVRFIRFPIDTNHDMSRTSNIYYKSLRISYILQFLNEIFND
ncbi:MAG: prolyl oligopeptidase family serine peptidase [bacterium]|nr:prolyl oligopeptidase family serine peptidase [bacterium]